MLTRIALSLTAFAALSLSACSTSSATHHDEATCREPKPGVITSVNSYCPVMLEDPVDPELTREWNGQKVGFCCDGCVKDWNAMTDAQKEAAVKTAVAKGKVQG